MSLSVFLQVYATAADIKTTLTLPLTSEGITKTFSMGLAAVFAIYYIFNFQYQEEAACTLEFIQR